jgi:hypothetical protein
MSKMNAVLENKLQDCWEANKMTCHRHGWVKCLARYVSCYFSCINFPHVVVFLSLACACIHMCVSVYSPVCVHLCLSVHMCVHVSVCMHMCVYVCVCLSVCQCVHVCMCVPVCVSACVCLCVCVRWACSILEWKAFSLSSWFPVRKLGDHLQSHIRAWAIQGWPLSSGCCVLKFLGVIILGEIGDSWQIEDIN